MFFYDIEWNNNKYFHFTFLEISSDFTLVAQERAAESTHRNRQELNVEYDKIVNKAFKPHCLNESIEFRKKESQNHETLINDKLIKISNLKRRNTYSDTLSLNPYL